MTPTLILVSPVSLCLVVEIPHCLLKLRNPFTFGEEEANSLPITAATGLGPTGWVLSTSGPGLGLGSGVLRLRPGLELGGKGALLFWLAPTSREGLPAVSRAGLDVLGS